MGFKAALDCSEKSIKELLDLAEKGKLDIEELPISEITGQYLDYIKADKPDTEDITGFLVSAAKLLSIKVKVLMPSTELEPEPWEEDVTDQLARHLMEYKTFKEAANLFKQRLEDDQKTYVRNNDLDDYVSSVSSSTALEGLGIGDLLNALEKVLSRETPEKEVPTFEIPRQEYRVSDKIEEVSRLVISCGDFGIEFEKLFSEHALKGEVIVTFLALLELVRLRKVRITQEHLFGTIMIFCAQ